MFESIKLAGVVAAFSLLTMSSHASYCPCGEIPPVIPDCCEVTEDRCHEFWGRPTVRTLQSLGEQVVDDIGCRHCEVPGAENQPDCKTVGEDLTFSVCVNAEGEFSVKTFGTGWTLKVGTEWCFETTRSWDLEVCILCNYGEVLRKDIFERQHEKEVSWDIEHTREILTASVEGGGCTCGVYEIPCGIEHETRTFIQKTYWTNLVEDGECPDDCPAGNPTALGLPSDLSFDEFVGAVSELESAQQMAFDSPAHSADPSILADSDGYLTTLSELYEMLYCAHADGGYEP